MNVRALTLLSILLLSAFDAGAETRDLNPPPLNAHPKQALHVTVAFDRPEDAKRYAIVMKAHYQNLQSECGYIESGWNRRFIYPEGTFEIPNKSRDPRRAQFDIYLDRYNSETCNWSLRLPPFRFGTPTQACGSRGTGDFAKIWCPARSTRPSVHSVKANIHKAASVEGTEYRIRLCTTGSLPADAYLSPCVYRRIPLRYLLAHQASSTIS